MKHRLIFRALATGIGFGLLSACHDPASSSSAGEAPVANAVDSTRAAVMDSLSPAGAGPLIPTRASEPFVDRSGAPRGPGASK